MDLRMWKMGDMEILRIADQPEKNLSCSTGEKGM